tara:strand:- start:2324 stop:2518 length:195 start_codon:yes stop_codon:yes gene_type:complete
MSWKDILKENNDIYEYPAHLIRRCAVCGQEKHLLEFSAKPGDSSRPHDDWQFRTTCNECEEKMQ